MGAHEPAEDNILNKFKIMQGGTRKTFRTHRGLVILLGSAVAGSVLCAWFCARSLFYNPDVNLFKKSHPYPWLDWAQTDCFKWMKTEVYQTRKGDNKYPLEFVREK